MTYYLGYFSSEEGLEEMQSSTSTLKIISVEVLRLNRFSSQHPHPLAMKKLGRVACAGPSTWAHDFGPCAVADPFEACNTNEKAPAWHGPLTLTEPL